MQIQTQRSAKRFITGLAAGLAGLLAMALAVLLLVDPYGVSPLRLPIDYIPMATNQRFSYPALIRRGSFDSAIIGTSTVRMLKPARLGRSLGTHTVNLAMDAATPWEEEQMLRLFRKHQPAPKLVIISLDQVWCNPVDPWEKLSPRAFPEWLFDDEDWFDVLRSLNTKALEIAGRRLAHALGLFPARYGPDGYLTLNFAGTPYDITRARQHIYGQPTQIPPLPARAEPAYLPAEISSWTFPDLARLVRLVTSLPAETVKLLLAPPYHDRLTGEPGSPTQIETSRCKARAAELLTDAPNTVLLDFWFRNDFTLDDANYWDRMHFREQPANRVEDVLISYLKTRSISDPIARVLLDTRQP